MREVWPCSMCSHCAVALGAGFVRDEIWKCIDRGEQVTEEDGCTFGDDSGKLIGVVAYDVDLSLTRPTVIE